MTLWLLDLMTIAIRTFANTTCLLFNNEVTANISEDRSKEHFDYCDIFLRLKGERDAIFLDMIDDNLVIIYIYMDDILIFVPDELVLAENTKKVLA